MKCRVDVDTHYAKEDVDSETEHEGEESREINEH